MHLGDLLHEFERDVPSKTATLAADQQVVKISAGADESWAEALLAETLDEMSGADLSRATVDGKNPAVDGGLSGQNEATALPLATAAPGQGDAHDLRSKRRPAAQPPRSQVRAPAGRGSKRPHRVWPLVSVLLLLLMVGQHVYFNFDRLSQRHPGAMQRLCSVFGCQLPPIDASALSIDSPRISVSPRNKQMVRIKARLINRSEEPQPMPSLRLDIYQRGQLNSRAVVLPADFLDEKWRHEKHIPPGESLPVQIDVQLERRKVSRFTLVPQYRWPGVA